MMGEHEHRVPEGWGVAPPASPWVGGAPWAWLATEHVAAHYCCADVSGRLAQQLVILVDGAALQTVRFAPRPQPDGPMVQALPTATERLLKRLVGARDEAVERDTDVEAKLVHGFLRV